ncbi:MAG: Lrp/AsnC family transcriptional regulator [Lautropia sp.]|nr:Lrp/AsnC family transcriptional regulator [Lautropia sp.]
MKKFDDRTSQAILRTLRENGRISWQELGKAVHLSGQAAAERVRQMQDAGVIDGFTVRESRLPRHFISVAMKHTDFTAFEAMVSTDPNVESLDKTSGDACYLIVYRTASNEELEAFLNRLLPHGGYRLASSLRRVR